MNLKLEHVDLTTLEADDLAAVNEKLCELAKRHAEDETLAGVLLSASTAVIEELFLRVCGGEHRGKLGELWARLQTSAG